MVFVFLVTFKEFSVIHLYLLECPISHLELEIWETTAINGFPKCVQQYNSTQEYLIIVKSSIASLSPYTKYPTTIVIDFSRHKWYKTESLRI